MACPHLFNDYLTILTLRLHPLPQFVPALNPTPPCHSRLRPRDRGIRTSLGRRNCIDERNTDARLRRYRRSMGEMVGGWLDKAYSTARSIADLDEAEYYWARARLADRRQHFAGAEREFRAALEVAPNEVGRTLDLATFLCSRGRYGESEAVFRGTVRRWNPCDRVMGRAHLGLEPVAEYLNVGSNDTIETSLLPLPKKKPKTGSCAFSTGTFRTPGPRGARRGRSARVPPPQI